MELKELRALYNSLKTQGTVGPWQDFKLVHKAELKARRKLEKREYTELALAYMEQRNEERMAIYEALYESS